MTCTPSVRFFMDNFGCLFSNSVEFTIQDFERIVSTYFVILSKSGFDSKTLTNGPRILGKTTTRFSGGWLIVRPGGASISLDLEIDAGGAGYQVSVYTQTWSDVEARLGSAAKAAQIGGNLNTMIMLRVKNTETAELLTDQLPKVNVYSSTLVSGSTGVQNPEDFADFGARTEDRLSSTEVPMLQPTDLVQLPKGQAFALIEGGQLVKLRLPLPSDESDQHWPASMEAVFTGMQAKYQRYVHQADAQEMPANFDGGIASKLTTEGAGSGF